MSEKQNNNYDSDKENVTPSSTCYRSKSSILYFDEKDLSTLSDTSGIAPNLTAHNSTTTVLNKILERVNVNDTSDRGNLLDLHDSSVDGSEVSFDQKSDSEVREGGSLPTSTVHLNLSVDSRRHPFDNSCIENFPQIGPDTFTQHEPEGEFKWSIEHKSEVEPVDINEDQPSYILEVQKKEYLDHTHQDKVKSYFENNAIAPSPCIAISRCLSRVPTAGESKESQTNITIPLDVDLEQLLGGQFLLSGEDNGPAATFSEASFCRMLFNNSETPDRLPGVQEQAFLAQDLSETDELSSPKIAPASPTSSDHSPSFVIFPEDHAMSSSSLLSPISKPAGNTFRTPGRCVTTPGPYNTPAPCFTPNICYGSSAARIASTPCIVYSAAQGSRATPGQGSPGQPSSDSWKTPGASKRKLTPDQSNLFKSAQFLSPFVSPIPPSLSFMKRHPKCPKKARHDSPKKHRLLENLSSPAESPADSLVSPADSLASPADSLASPAPSLPSPDSFPPKAPMESSRIDSGTDVSSDGEKEKTKLMALLQMGIQPLDISEIKPQDNTKKLRTNNYLDISDKADTSANTNNTCCHGNTNNTCCHGNTNNTCCHGNNTCSCTQQLRSKDSGFGTSSAMSTISTATLPPLSEVSNILALDSRPGKRKFESSPGGKDTDKLDESGFYPPPVKRIVVATETAAGRRKHRSLE